MSSGSWFDTLAHPRVRDLAWSLLCPPLNSFGRQPPPGFDMAGIEAQMRQLDRDPAPLEAFLARSPVRRLGLYHERLLEYHLEQHPQVSELQRGVPVRRQGVTLGELDFLYRFTSLPGFVHLEVAFKFFLRVNGEWLGLDPQDSLSRKVERMSHHQIPLSAGEAFRTQLGPGRRVERRLGWIKGCLFEPWQNRPGRTSDTGWRGWWLYADQVHSLRGGHYLPLERHRWLSPARAADDACLFEVETLAGEDFGRARMVARMEEGPEGWHEADRGLVMPRSWPGQSLTVSRFGARSV